MKKLIITLAGIGTTVLMAIAETVAWTGNAVVGGVGCWTNAANWANNVVPGQYVGSDGAGRGQIGDSVSFTVGEDDLTIDLDGCTSIGNVVVTGGGRGKLTFGTSTAQSLRLELGGVFSVDASVTTSPEVLAGAGSYTSQWDAGPQVHYENNSLDAELVLHDLGHALIYDKSDWTSRRYNLRGKGAIRILGNVKAVDSFDCDFGISRLVIASPIQFASMRTYGPQTRQTVVIEENAKLTVGAYGQNGVWFETGMGLDIVGDGEFQIVGGTLGGYWANGQQLFGSVSDTKIACAIFSGLDMGEASDVTGKMPVGLRLAAGQSHPSYDAGTVYLQSPDCRLAGWGEFYGATWTHVESLGLKGEQGSLGWCTNIYLMNNARIVYDGPGEATDRDLHIGRQAQIMKSGFVAKPTPENAAFEFEQAGTGPLFVNSTLDCTETDVSPKLTLLNSTAHEANWTGDLTVRGLSVVKDGLGNWTLSGVNQYDGKTVVKDGRLVVERLESLVNSSALELRGGTLAIGGAGSTKAATLKELTVSAKSALELKDGVQLTLPSISLEQDASLDIVTDDDLSVVRVEGASAGEAHGITLNGLLAYFDENGRLVSDVTTWQSADSGSWHESGNWSRGVPTQNAVARIAVGVPELNVAVDSSASVSNLTVRNGSGVTTLAVSNAVAIPPCGGLTVGPGANVLFGMGSTAAWEKLSTFKLSNGGVFTVDGGNVSLAGCETAGLDISSSDPAQTSVIRVVSGKMSSSRVNGNDTFEMRAGACLHATGGVFELKANEWLATVGSFLGGMTHLFAGDSVFSVESIDEGRIQCDGDIDFRESSSLSRTFDVVRVLAFSSATDGGRCRMRFCDDARLAASKSTLVLGCPASARSATDVSTSLLLDSDATHDLNGLWAGCERTSVAEVEMRKGCLNLDWNGLRLGASWESFWSEGSRARGVFRMSGGVANVKGLSHSEFADDLIGVSVGSGLNDGPSAFENYRYSGRFVQTGGALTNESGYIVVGTGRADGELIIDGGSFCQADTETARARPCPQVVGALTGTGLFAVSNGTVRLNTGTSMWVGGISMDAVRASGYFPLLISQGKGDRILSKAVKDPGKTASGKVEVVSGSLVSAGDLILGAEGHGEISVVGSEGEVQFAGLVMSNQLESVARFVFDVEGVKPLSLTGKAVLSNGARLVVDMNAYRGERKNYRLIVCSGLEGAFDPQKIEVVGAAGDYKDAVVSRDVRGYKLRLPKGMAITIR